MFTMLVMIVNGLGLILGIVGLLMFDQTDYLGCSKSGLRWLYLSVLGNFFHFLHMLVIVAHCIICLQIIYKIPASTGRFKEDIGTLRDISNGEIVTDQDK